jgi:hypothetical protein
MFCLFTPHRCTLNIALAIYNCVSLSFTCSLNHYLIKYFVRHLRTPHNHLFSTKSIIQYLVVKCYKSKQPNSFLSFVKNST